MKIIGLQLCEIFYSFLSNSFINSRNSKSGFTYIPRDIKSLSASIILISLLMSFFTKTEAQFTEVSSTGLPGINHNSVAWGDYDNDGYLDILLTGEISSNNEISKIYHNTGSGFTEAYSLTGVAYGSAAWGDYDNDGDLDIILAGYTGGNQKTTIIYQNTGSGFTAMTGSGYTLPGVAYSSVAWGDKDNDGDLDILLTGYNGSYNISKVYYNTGSGFAEAHDLPTRVASSSVAWGDYDNDGDLDILSTGMDLTYGTYSSKIYRNTGSDFTEVYSLTGVVNGSAAWGDYDNDGDLDVLITGSLGYGNGEIAKVYQNTGSGFSEVYNLTAVSFSSVAWGDYDNDGDLDILLTGYTGSSVVSKIFNNTGSGFTEMTGSGYSLTGVQYSSAAWGDYDNDGDLDILLTGSFVTKLYKNETVTTNTVPSSPGNLHNSISGTSVTFSWDKSTDSQTSQNGLNYNLVIGQTSNGVDILSPMADRSTGYRRVAQLGNSQTNSITIKDLTPGEYYWSVQAIDNAFAGSAFAEEGYFSLEPTVQTSNLILTPVTGDKVTLNWTNGNGTKRIVIIKEGSAVDAVPVDLNTYTANQIFGNGTQIGTGNYVVYNGSGSSVTVAGLKSLTTYYAAVYEYAGSEAKENYFTASPATGNAATLALFSEQAFSLTNISSGSVNWGDYDNDNDLDILLTGYSGSSPISKIYQNTGNGFTGITDVAYVLPGITSGTSSWGDYDNDGDLDILLTGDTGSQNITRIYKNTGSGFTLEYDLTGIYSGSAAWSDYDNDGDLDILSTGNTGSNRISKIYQNTGSGFTGVYSLTGVSNSSVAWGDYDNDGDADILLTGNTGSDYISKIYQNTGSGFTETFSLNGIYNGSAAWGDYDNDGDLDILLCGYNSGSNPISKIYQNTGNGFTEMTDASYTLTGVAVCSAAWGDCDNDGDLDILLTGYANSSPISKIYKNTGSGFNEENGVDYSLTGVLNSSATWEDYDNDGDLDILLTGYDASYTPISKIYNNGTLTVNTVPTAPTNLHSTINGSDVTFTWDKSTDSETPQSGLNYNLVIETEVSGTYKLTPMANTTTGFRKVVRPGNSQTNSITIKNIASATYHWSVQAIDASFAGSPFAAEIVEPLPVELTSFTAVAMENKVVLNWQTATEVNNYGFSIERSQKSEDRSQNNWSEVGFVEGNGNSNSTKQYSFVDKDVAIGSYSYRLKQIDIDGSYSYSKEVEVKAEAKEIPGEFALYQNYPNPFNPTTVISFQIPVVSQVQLKIYDILGNEVATLVNEPKEPGVYEVEFNASNFPSGVFFYRIAIHSDKLTAGEFGQTRKMLLIK